jgi:DNA-binding CsgD family transcriptional regulator
MSCGMVDTVSLAEALTRLEMILRARLTPQQYDSCALLLPALDAAVGVLRRLSLASPALEPVSDDVLRLRFRLTKRETQVLRLLVLGRSNSAVASGLGISAHTARHHTERILMKLRVHSRAQLVAAIGGRLAVAGSDGR